MAGIPRTAFLAHTNTTEVYALMKLTLVEACRKQKDQ